jgi:thiopurine S-methyltransferase
MHPSFWHDRWHSGQIGFHQADVNPHLQRFWPDLHLPASARVFVPLCGKSLDMAWLAGRGHPIVGVELSAIAIREFFTAARATPTIRDTGHFRHWSAAGIELLEGDYFELERQDIGTVGAVYDRAALVALPPALRPRYAQYLAHLTPADAPVMLITMNYAASGMNGPPFAVTNEEVEELFREHFQLEMLQTLDALPSYPGFRDRGLDWLEESVWRLRRSA